jgi:hypothetical protein
MNLAQFPQEGQSIVVDLTNDFNERPRLPIFIDLTVDEEDPTSVVVDFDDFELFGIDEF